MPKGGETPGTGIIIGSAGRAFAVSGTVLIALHVITHLFARQACSIATVFPILRQKK